MLLKFFQKRLNYNPTCIISVERKLSKNCKSHDAVSRFRADTWFFRRAVKWLITAQTSSKTNFFGVALRLSVGKDFLFFSQNLKGIRQTVAQEYQESSRYSLKVCLVEIFPLLILSQTFSSAKPPKVIFELFAFVYSFI